MDCLISSFVLTYFLYFSSLYLSVCYIWTMASDLLANSYVQTTIKPTCWVYFNFNLSWMTFYLLWPKTGNSILGCSPGLLAVFIQSPFKEQTAHFPWFQLLASHKVFHPHRVIKTPTLSNWKSRYGHPRLVWWLHEAAKDLDTFDFLSPSSLGNGIYPLIAFSGIPSLKSPHSFCLISLSRTRSYGDPKLQGKLEEWVFWWSLLFPSWNNCGSLHKVVEQVGMELLTCNICYTECYSHVGEEIVAQRSMVI